MSWYFLATSVTNSWHYLTLLDDSWTVGRTMNFWKFVEHVQNEKELVKNSQEESDEAVKMLSRSWQEHVTKS